MLNKEKHQLIMGQILKDIYTDISIAPLLGFKGGTCAYFFYGLPRFSVDLDFDLLKNIDGKNKKNIFEKIVNIIGKYGKVKDSHIKQFTIFALLSYGDEDHNIKIEISTRNFMPNLETFYILKEYLAISMLVAKKEYLFAGKLVALTQRSDMAMRDVYDIYYFGKNNWDFDKKIVEVLTGNNFSECISNGIDLVEFIKDNQLLAGLGELVNEKEKSWIKQNLKNEVLFILKNYQKVIK
ncbi:MAG: nucleotidyl transferase AbiEii/AbiGii toxin family protein [bacterium]|nr:nucleotidyl transferase AbiEii/AbiGii toxin family protein [bacterium]